MRKVFLVVSIVFIILFGVLQLFITLFRPTDADELRTRAAQLPSLTLTKADGSSFAFPPGKPVVLIYFNTTCDHCQRQIQSLQASASLLKGTPMVLMSSQPAEDVFAYAATLRFLTADVHVVKCKADEIAEQFGLLSLPQIFVYSKEGELIELFAGETQPQKIAAALNR